MDGGTVTLKQLRYLVTLDETKHYRRAAEICGISQPSLSAQIQNIEEGLGVRLVERGRSGASLTPVGREVVARGRKILDEMQSLVDFTAGAQRGLAGTIRLGAKATLGPYLLPHVVARLHRQHPELNLYVRESAPKELEFELARGTHDVILAQLPVTTQELVAERLFREPLYLALATDHPLAKEEHVLPAQLKGLDILTLSPQFHLHEQIAQICKESGARVLRDYEGTSLDALRLMVGMGMGAAFLPAIYAQSEIPARGEVVVRRLKGRPIMRSVGLVWRRSAGRYEAYQHISTLIREVVAKRFRDIVVEHG